MEEDFYRAWLPGLLSQSHWKLRTCTAKYFNPANCFSSDHKVLSLRSPLEVFCTLTALPRTVTVEIWPALNEMPLSTRNVEELVRKNEVIQQLMMIPYKLHF